MTEDDARGLTNEDVELLGAIGVLTITEAVAREIAGAGRAATAPAGAVKGQVVRATDDRRWFVRPFPTGSFTAPGPICVLASPMTLAGVQDETERLPLDRFDGAVVIGFIPEAEPDLVAGDEDADADDDPIDHPAHYTSHPSGVECIDVVEHMTFNVGNAIKYLWRAGLKGDTVEDLRTAEWYVQRELARLERE